MFTGVSAPGVVSPKSLVPPAFVATSASLVVALVVVVLVLLDPSVEFSLVLVALPPGVTDDCVVLPPWVVLNVEFEPGPGSDGAPLVDAVVVVRLGLTALAQTEHGEVTVTRSASVSTTLMV